MEETLKELIENGLVFPAMLPDKNDFILSDEGKQKKMELANNLDAVEKFHNLPFEEKRRFLDLESLDKLVGYTIPLIAHDYGAKTPVMWNTLYEEQGMHIRNIMVVGDPKKARDILATLKTDKKYLGGGAGVGFKEAVMPYIDSLEPEDIKAVNIILKRNGQLVGCNTDSEGLMRGLEEKLEAVGKTAKNENFVIIGAGGVAQQFARTLAERNASYLAIINRTFSKAVSLASSLNRKYDKSFAVGLGENMTRGVLLNSEKAPAAIINLSDKGSDMLSATAMFYSAGDANENVSRTMVEHAMKLRPDLIYADIVLPKSGRSISLRIVDSLGIDPMYTLDGKPMVIYQAVPAYKMIETAHSQLHCEVPEQKVLETFKKAAA